MTVTKKNRHARNKEEKARHPNYGGKIIHTYMPVTKKKCVPITERRNEIRQ